MDNRFVQVGIRPAQNPPVQEKKRYKDKPVVSMAVFMIIAMGCLFCNFFITKDPAYMDLYNANAAPGTEFYFGADAMGRDIFSMIWYGGRISLFIGFFASAVSTVIAIFFGVLSGLAPRWADDCLMRFTEIFLSIPSLLLVIMIQAVLGKANVFSISFVIGITSWTGMAKVVRTEVKQIRGSEYVIAARCMGAGFFRILLRHLTPNFISSIMFMVVMNIRAAIAAESALSFMGMGLPLEIISWGSMLSLAERSLLSGAWWIILVPGAFLAVTLLCITDIGNYLRKSVNNRRSNL